MTMIRIMSMENIGFHRFKVLVINTIFNEFRNKSVIFFSIFTLLVIYADHALINFIEGNLPGMAPSDTLVDMKMKAFYWIISSWNGLMAIILGINTVKADLNMQIMPQLFAWPIKRMEYLFARIVGSWIVIVGYYIISIILAYIVFKFFGTGASIGASIGAAASAGGGMLSLFSSIIVSVLLSSLMILTVITIAVFFSLYLSKVWGLIVSILAIGFIGQANSYFSMVPFSEITDKLDGIFSIIKLLLHYLIPRVGVLSNMAVQVFMGATMDRNIFFELLHFVASYALLFYFLLFVFKRREL
ncbi:MAG: hypothetical protein HQK49_00340 [Oligoflexia bacterium]|nr:hypothetical protein [Oligoflexia bacterium]